jgi:Protein of unknown function (DUF3047)
MRFPPGRAIPWLLLLAVVAIVLALDRGTRLNVLRPHGERELAVMDFSTPFPLDPPPAGWLHRRFWTRQPMTMSFQEKDGVAALRMATNASASMLFRHVDVDVAAYPFLTWRWYIEQPIDAPADEETRAGDDHPARLFLAFRTARGESRRMEIIWGDKLHAGQYKFIGTFPHYVADGGDENIRQWRNEAVDLRQIARPIWPDLFGPQEQPMHLVDIALFCDSDDTRTQSIAYVADVKLARTQPAPPPLAATGTSPPEAAPSSPAGRTSR